MARASEPKATRGKRRAGQLVGYLRVSSLDQKELRQLEGVALDKRFVDKASCRDLHRPQLEQLTSYVREGDTVVCHAMDRLARNLDDLRRVVLGFTERGVHVRFEKENLTFTGEDSPMSHLLLSVMGAFAQFERDLIRERQREGIALAKLREGTYTGRKHCLTPAQAKELCGELLTGSARSLSPLNWASAALRCIGTSRGQRSDATADWKRRLFAAVRTGDVYAGDPGASAAARATPRPSRAEELLRHKQQIAAIDPTGAWWGLRSSSTGEGPGYPVVVFGGDHADAPLEPHAGRMLAGALVEHGFSAIFDVGLMLTEDQIRFVSDFASELLRINRSPPVYR